MELLNHIRFLYNAQDNPDEVDIEIKKNKKRGNGGVTRADVRDHFAREMCLSDAGAADGAGLKVVREKGRLKLEVRR